ncbi:hypothetical protein [Sphingosinicella rhizophila]|uniref:Uncharacterized protein n=1 Tax=Sphingosinicella rhizophila TaxID=3050082 RepID=A0ABU3QDD9_9SPHN|nr:hypothetical protein [Sphingosinicella sp. GR2756]MDT9601003.1 hypothetical protein [Sphingosinicella sp. GR2756]
MNEQNNRSSGISGSDSHQSESVGGSASLGGNRERQQDGNSGGRYDQNRENHQGQQQDDKVGLAGDTSRSGGSDGQSRGERYDEMQGGGRGGSALAEGQGSIQDGRRNQDRSGSEQQQSGASEFEQDQREHQDRGQSIVSEGDRS